MGNLPQDQPLATTDNRHACPCGSGADFSDCCGPYLQGLSPAPTAAALMRSRYTAYTLRDAAYVLRTWHPSSRPPVLDLANDDSDWLGLALLNRERGQPDDTEGVVEFIARYRQGGSDRQLHEISRFVREDGCWLYLDGSAGTRKTRPGRNDPCSCGSGKKFKKCCGA